MKNNLTLIKTFKFFYRYNVIALYIDRVDDGARVIPMCLRKYKKEDWIFYVSIL